MTTNWYVCILLPNVSVCLKLCLVLRCSWYHPNADRHISESLLMQNGEEGSYLVRPSSKSNMFTLSVRYVSAFTDFHSQCNFMSTLLNCLPACMRITKWMLCGIYRGQDSVKHYNITVNGTEYQFGMATLKNMREFMEHFASQPLLAGESGNILEHRNSGLQF